jgi:hypothetical protein
MVLKTEREIRGNGSQQNIRYYDEEEESNSSLTLYDDGNDKM